MGLYTSSQTAVSPGGELEIHSGSFSSEGGYMKYTKVPLVVAEETDSEYKLLVKDLEVVYHPHGEVVVHH